MDFRILGPVEVIHDGRALAVGGPRARAVLAMLLLNANRVVSADWLAGELWPGLGPDRAAANLQVRLTELRRALRSAGQADRLVTRPPGYVFRVTVSELDVLLFEQLAAAGRAALAGGDAIGASRILADSLGLWRGPALADLDDPLFRAVLPAIHVPTMVIQRLDDRMTPPCHRRYLASHISGARYFEQRGDHALRFAGSGDGDTLIDEIEHFLASAPTPCDPDRVLAAILVAETTGVPQEAPAAHHVRSYRGRLITTTRTGVLATFAAPGQAIRCAAAVRDNAVARGIQLRAGVHVGEVDPVGDDIGDPSVHITRGIAALAQPDEILVSRTVKDLVVGTGISFADRGGHELSGVSDRWQLFAVTGSAEARRPSTRGR